MTIEDQIAALQAKAEPLRLLDDREAELQGLGLIVERINALRAQEAAEKHGAYVAALTGAVVEPTQEPKAEAEEKRKPGRPKKVEAD